ncbi:MAG: GAF domain-containing protein, partial [Chloroflexota bacterium]
QFVDLGFNNSVGRVDGFLANEIWLKNYNQVTHIPNVPESDSVSKESKETISQMKATAFCVIPLRSGRRWQGVMTLSWPEAYSLSETESFLLENLREPLGAIVARHRSQVAAQEARQESEQLYNASSQLNQAASDLDNIVQVVADLAQPIGIDQTALAFTRLDRNGEAVGLEVSAVHSDAELEKYVEVGDRFGRSAHEQISTFEGAYFIENVEEAAGLTTGTKRLLDQLDSPAAGILPLNVGDREVGFVFLLSNEPMEFEENSRRLFSSLAPQIAVAVQNSIFLADAQTRANREQMLRQISEKVRNTADVESVMRTAVTEIGRVLGRKTFLYLKSNDDDDTHTNLAR